MSNLAISQLPSSSGLTGTEVLPIVQSGTTVQTTAQDIADLSSANLSEVSEDITPLFDGVYDIGTEEKKWFDGFFTNKVQIGTSSIQTDIDDDLTVNTNLIVQGTVSSEIGDFGDITISGNTISKIFDEYGGGDETIIVDGDLDIVGEILQNGVPLSLGVIQEGTGVGSTVRIDNNNTASADSSTVGGGVGNTSSGYNSTVGGGRNNTASGLFSTIGGGDVNSAGGYGSTIGGGTNNGGEGARSTIGGGRNNGAVGDYSTIGGGRFNGAIGYASTVGGGLQNTTSGCISTVGGGRYNTASGCYSTVSGGRNNTASYYNSTIGGGRCNISNCFGSTIGGGIQNTSSGYLSTIGGGRNNAASACNSAILGGICNNTANCNCAMIVGSCITADRVCTTFVNNLSIMNLPTSAPAQSGAVWRDTSTTPNTLRIV